MNSRDASQVCWEFAEVSSPRLDRPVPVVVARDIPYVPGGNRLQNLSLYLPRTAQTASLAGLPATVLPTQTSPAGIPSSLVHIHGGAWRDPLHDARTIEPTVAHAFSDFSSSSPIRAVAALNYSLSQFPTHPSDPYDTAEKQHSDPAREAVHPRHVSDIFQGLALLRSLGFRDQSYILAGHSCGACLAFQVALKPPGYYGLEGAPEVPCPAAVIGLNGVYDLPAAVHGLDAAHQNSSSDNKLVLLNAFGDDERNWSAASPAHFDAAEIMERVRAGAAPRLVVLDQSEDDQVVPMNQRQRLEANLRKVRGLRVVLGHRCTGKHSAPWQQGFMIWDSVRDALALLQEAKSGSRGQQTAYGGF